MSARALRVALVAAVACAGLAAPARRATAGPVSVVASGLLAPWEVAFTPTGTAYVGERDTGLLWRIDPGRARRLVQRVHSVPGGEGGLLGLAWRKGMLYAYTSTLSDNRITRFRPGRRAQVVLSGITRSFAMHNGGRIAFGPDGMLYATVGDASDADRSQDLASLNGKILRMTPGGDVPPDNPFAGSHVYAYGFRNPQGLAWDASGRLFASDFGPDEDDEINLVVPGGNYGWPEVTGVASDPRFVDPVAVQQPPDASWSGIEIPLGSADPEWDGDLFVASLRGGRLWRLELDGGAVAATEALFTGRFGRLRTVAQAPDGSLWLLTSNRDGRGRARSADDRILRIAAGSV